MVYLSICRAVFINPFCLRKIKKKEGGVGGGGHPPFLF